ncbi:GlcG/HbpS family heme-binding protein [Natronorubrum aibiense]|uniref:Heme-binding protein n=1 Tax=Natronorubrum aibiense TaxID=348826 RepID=A0A5P9P9B6_9EURY|nr:heme-binding protein [Natronorubrum aibiense]QFU84587.1 heme-binding protein [Natronorubrum aibiense]
MTDVTLDTAKEMIEAAEGEAAEIGVPMCIAVMDEGANLVAFHRMDGALLASVDIAQNKAYSSVSLKMDTETIHEVSQPGESLYGLGNTNDGRIITFGGGLPLEDESGDVVGGIGVSGGSAEEDIQVAQAGADAFERS